MIAHFSVRREGEHVALFVRDWSSPEGRPGLPIEFGDTEPLTAEEFKPFITIRDQDAQGLMVALWEAGIRPTVMRTVRLDHEEASQAA